MQEWQYSSGIVLYNLFMPDIPVWRVAVGAAAIARPLYEGARDYRVFGGPVVDVRYKDIAFASVGEGLGVNVVSGPNYRAGIALSYDLGRLARHDLTHLKGLGDISAAPVLKLFSSYVVSKGFPLVLRADLRQFVGGADGLAADVGAYLPLPGSSKTFVMFAGPSFTVANRLHHQTVYGVSTAQAVASGYPAYQAHGGPDSAGLGFTATWILSERWLINADLAFDELLGSGKDSPITQSRAQKVAIVSTAYQW
ncbi:MAG: MipA/OmpV family protein [Steroidobacteraceae bacterium]